jgi:hypothetical protein
VRVLGFTPGAAKNKNLLYRGKLMNRYLTRCSFTFAAALLLCCTSLSANDLGAGPEADPDVDQAPSDEDLSTNNDLLSAAGAMKNPNPWMSRVPPMRRDTEAYRKPNSCGGHRFEKHQYARACYRISDDGKMLVWSKFTNNKLIDGDHFTALWVFLDSDGKLVTWLRQSAALDGDAVGGPGDVYRRTKGKISANDVKRIASVRVKWDRPNTKDDLKEIGRAIDLICKLAGCSDAEDDDTETSRKLLEAKRLKL